MKRTAMVAGVSVAALLCAWTASAPAAPFAQSPSYGRFGYFSRQPFDAPPRRPANKADKKSKPDADSKAALSEADKAPPAPKGLLHVIVSLDKQRATLFADGVAVAQSKISSGTPQHPTPMGVFNILQKHRHHVSNLYDAPMPYMQRITWSGSALHEGPLPGYPASHGCVRLPTDFAQILWRATKLGARVIITRDEAAPVAIEHERLVFAKASTDDIKAMPGLMPGLTPNPAPQPEPAVKPNIVPKADPKPDLISEPKTPPARNSEPVATRPAPLLKTVDASPMLRGAIPDAVRPLVPVTVRNAMAAEQPTKLPLSDDVVAMPPVPASAAIGTTAAPVRPIPAETMAKADTIEVSKIEVPKIEVPKPQTRTEPATAPALPAQESSPVVAAPPPPAAPAVAAKEPPRRKGIVSMFISLKEQRLYVRQNMEPLFTAPVTIARPGEPIGTHVYTAMGSKASGDGLRWTVVSIPSASKPAPPEPKTTANGGKKPRNEKPAVKTAEIIHVPLPSPSAALDRITMPQDAVDRIATLITPGASLIVSDNKLSGETGDTTDFIVETK
jgi:lipoprotein-anchoring transpeptidase ErfK/SrfK